MSVDPHEMYKDFMATFHDRAAKELKCRFQAFEMAKYENIIQQTDRLTDEMIAKIEMSADTSRINDLRSTEFVRNSRNQVLHVRSSWPSNPTETKAIVIAHHGYASHVNRPEHKLISEKLVSLNIAYISVDFHGHGYSDGLRGYVRNTDDLIDDSISLIDALYSPTITSEKHLLIRNGDDIPFYIMGHSMGGGLAIVVADLLYRVQRLSSDSSTSQETLSDHMPSRLSGSTIREYANKFRGGIFVCPVIEVLQNASLVRSILDYTIVSWFSTTPLPLGDDNAALKEIWANEAYLKYIVDDGYPNNPEGLSYGGNIRFGTLSTILALGELAKATAPTASYPYIIFHDPEDAVVKFSGTEYFYERSPSCSKTVVCVIGGLHDPFANKLGCVLDRLAVWFCF